jgi:hypothetical protein
VEEGYLCLGCRPGRGKGWDSNPRLARLYLLGLSPPNGSPLSSGGARSNLSRAPAATALPTNREPTPDSARRGRNVARYKTAAACCSRLLGGRL